MRRQQVKEKSLNCLFALRLNKELGKPKELARCKVMSLNLNALSMIQGNNKNGLNIELDVNISNEKQKSKIKVMVKQYLNLFRCFT